MGQGSKTPAEIPTQFRPAGTDWDRAASAFRKATDTDDNDKRLAREAEALAVHNQSMNAAQNGQTSAGGRRLSAAALAIAANLIQQQEQKKTGDKDFERAAKQAMDAMQRRLEAIAAYWDAKADKIENKLGGLDGIAQKLGVERPKNMTDEEYRRWLNQTILDRVAAGQLDPDDDMAVMARARQAAQDARDAKRRAAEELENGNPQEAERIVHDFEQRVLMDRTKQGLNNEQLISMIDKETIERVALGEDVSGISQNASMEDRVMDDFYGTDDFAASAADLAMTESFNLAAQGQPIEPMNELSINQGMQSAVKPPGMLGA